jgi:hypothetical protein
MARLRIRISGQLSSFPRLQWSARHTASILGRPAGSSRRLRNEGLEADHIENGDELPKQFGHRLDLLARPKETGSFRHHSNVPTSSSALSALPILSRFRL